MFIKKIAIFGLLLLSLSPVFPQQKEYLLTWNYLPGFEAIFHQRMVVENERFALDKDQKTPKEKVFGTTITVESTVYNQVISVKGSEMIGATLFKNGKITIQEGPRSRVYNIDTPEAARVAMKDPIAVPYVEQCIGGFAYSRNIKTGEIDGTWRMEAVELRKDDKSKKDEVKYKRIPAGKDPKNLSSGHWILPNAKVALGHKWNRRQMGRFTENLKFEKVLDYKNRKVAQISRDGVLLRNEKKVGKIQGTILLDIEWRVPMKHDSITTSEQRPPAPNSNYLEKSKITFEMVLISTNIEQLKKSQKNK